MTYPYAYRYGYWRTPWPASTLPGVRLVSSVSGPIIPLETVRRQCEVEPIEGDSDAETHPDDDLLLGMLEAAVDHAEDYTGLTLALRTYEMALDSFPYAWESSGIFLPRGPVIAIESFTAVDGGSDGELDLGDDFHLDAYRTPARLLPVTSWTSLTTGINAIKIRYLAGYQSADYTDSDYAGAQTLPAAIRAAILLMVGHLYANREATAEKTISTVPLGFMDLLRPKRVILGMA